METSSLLDNFVNKSVGISRVGGDWTARDARPSGRKRDPSRKDSRSESRRDYDRILYSSGWRRLSGVTQVVTPFEDLPSMHTRLTHSEKVAQVARSIGTKLAEDDGLAPVLHRLGGLDVAVCEAAALAHDLGHPPFGHVGEEVLDKVARESLGLRDGFEGNAQTIRSVSIGKLRSNLYEGLDLTAATLAAISKYPWLRPTSENHDQEYAASPRYRKEWNKFNFYDCHEDLLHFSRKATALPDKTQSLEASVMDIADDIAYAIHDLEDFYLGGILNVPAIKDDLEGLERNGTAPTGQPETAFVTLLKRLEKDYPEWYSEEMATTAAGQVIDTLRKGFSPRALQQAQAEAMARQEASILIEGFIRGTEVREEPFWDGGPHVMVERTDWHKIQILKEITRSYVISRPDFALLQRGQQLILTNLVAMLKEWLDGDMGRLPVKLKEEKDIADGLLQGSLTLGYGKQQHAARGNSYRVILDYLCALTDAQCIMLHQKLSGSQVHRLAFNGIF